MPLYEYQCEACAQRFEIIQKFSDPHPETCAKCGKGPVQRLISTPAIQFKGSGWYITDYAGGRSSAASAATASGDDAPKTNAAPSESSANTKSETAPKADSKPATSE